MVYIPAKGVTRLLWNDDRPCREGLPSSCLSRFGWKARRGLPFWRAAPQEFFSTLDPFIPNTAAPEKLRLGDREHVSERSTKLLGIEVEWHQLCPLESEASRTANCFRPVVESVCAVGY